MADDPALLALAEILAFIPDANNGQAPAVVAWWIKHRDIIYTAAKEHDKLTYLSVKYAQIPDSFLEDIPDARVYTGPLDKNVKPS